MSPPLLETKPKGSCLVGLNIQKQNSIPSKIIQQTLINQNFMLMGFFSFFVLLYDIFLNLPSYFSCFAFPGLSISMPLLSGLFLPLALLSKLMPNISKEKMAPFSLEAFYMTSRVEIVAYSPMIP